MRVPRFSAAFSLIAGLSLAGCASTPEGSAEAPVESTRASAPEVGTKDTKTASVADKVAVSSSSSREPERTSPSTRESASRSEAASSSSSSARSDSRDDGANSPARLITQLNDATREIASLRAANAKLKAAPAAAAPVSAAPRELDPAEAKLAANVKSYAQFKQDLATVFADAERLRGENAALTSQLKEASSGSKDVKSAIAKLEGDLRTERTYTTKLESDLKAEKAAVAKLDAELKAEKAARAQADQATAKLREQLRAVASAASSGLESPSNAADSRSRSSSATTRRHVLKNGDTLEKLADRYYGDADKWRVILDANRGRLPLDGTLPSGLELEIPAK